MNSNMNNMSNNMNDDMGGNCRGCDGMNVQMNQRMNQSQLLDWVSMLGFCAYDMLLYLDTHPTDTRALDYYEQCNQLYQNAKSSYEASYGPLTIDAAGERNGIWDWGKQPLPWEGVI